MKEKREEEKDENKEDAETPEPEFDLSALPMHLQFLHAMLIVRQRFQTSFHVALIFYH